MSEIVANESGLDARTTLNTALAADVVLSTANAGGFDDGRVLVDTVSVTWDRSTPGEISATATGSGSAPGNAQYIVAASDATLTAERVATDTATVTWDFGTAAQAKANVVGSAVTGVVAAGFSFTQTHVVLGRNTSGAGAGEEVTPSQFMNWGTINFTVGFSGTSNNLGTITTGTVTPSPANGQYQRYVNGGAHTLAPPSTGSGDSTDVVLQITNNGSAGAVTTSGFTKVSGAFTTTNGDDFLAYCTVCNGFSYLNIVALQ